MKYLWSAMLAASTLAAQPVSSYKYTVKGDEKSIEITNVNYEFTKANLVLRSTVKSKEVIGDIGMEATTTVEAWKLGVDIKQKPLYTVTVQGRDPRTLEEEVFVISRGLEEVAWWSVYRVANGAHLFDSYVPVVKFPINRESETTRYAGLEIPEDDKVKDPKMVGVVSYASEAKVIREAVITSDDPKQAQLLRSFADETRTLSHVGEKALTVSFSQNYPSPPATISITIPIVADNLDLQHAQLPPHVHIAAKTH
jgi:hypothetical protein